MSHVDEYAVNIQDEKSPLLASGQSYTQVGEGGVSVVDPTGSYEEDEEDVDLRDNSGHFDRARHGTSNFSTIMHIIKGNVGTGILAMPIAFSNAGILVGTLGLAMMGIICIHCMHLLVNSSHYLCKKLNKSHLDYSGVAEQSFKLCSSRLSRFSKIARNTVNVFLMITQFGFCCVYILFIAKNIKLVVDKCIGNDPDDPIHYRDWYPMRIQLYELCLVALLIPFVFIKNIKHLAPFSMLANIASLIGLAIILYYVLFYEELQSISRLPLFNGWKRLPLYFGTAIYAFEGIGVVLPLENKMKEPHIFPAWFGVLNLGMVIVCVLYITTGFYGYIAFGEECDGSVTLNLKSWFGIVTQVIFSLCIFVSYGLQFFVPMEIIGSSLNHTYIARKVGPSIFNYLLRTFFVLLTFAVAAAVDQYLDLLIALLGSVASSALALIFPALLDIITFWPDRHQQKNYWLKFAKNIAIFIFGVVGFVFGTITALEQLIAKLGGN